MAAWSIIQFARLNDGMDFDAEHYNPQRLSAWSALARKAKKTVGDFALEIEDLRNPISAKPSFDLTAALNQFLTLDGTIGATSVKKIAAPNDVLVSRLRSYLREVCLVPTRGQGFLPQLSTEFIVIRSRSNQSIAWLVPFILSEPVQAVLRWAQTGSNHPRFSATTLLRIPVNPAIESVVDKLSMLTENAVREYELSTTAYPAAEAELLERLSWDELRRQPAELSYVCGFSGITAAARSDAEFFQPQCDRLARRLTERGAQTIGGFCPKPTRGVQPEIIEGGDVVVVDSKAVRPQGVEPAPGERTSSDFRALPANAKASVQSGDVLLNSTGRGTLGRAACYQLDVPALCDNHVAVLRPDTKVCDPVYLALFLNSPAGLAQSEQFQTGSSGQLEIYPEHIQQFLIYLPRQKDGKVDLAWQKRLAAKVEASIVAKTAARSKLEEAKALIENALILP